VTVYLLENMNVRLEVESQAQGLASRMFGSIGIHLIWRRGRPPLYSSSQPIVIEVTTDRHAKGPTDAMAETLVFEGVHIIIYYDLVSERGSTGAVLGHVMVHEITHILQGVNRHSSSGVMKAVWSSEDFARMRYRPLPFTDEDVRLIRLGLEARAAHASLRPSTSR
jgi:hypothetical protein